MNPVSSGAGGPRLRLRDVVDDAGEQVRYPLRGGTTRGASSAWFLDHSRPEVSSHALRETRRQAAADELDSIDMARAEYTVTPMHAT